MEFTGPFCDLFYIHCLDTFQLYRILNKSNLAGKVIMGYEHIKIWSQFHHMTRVVWRACMVTRVPVTRCQPVIQLYRFRCRVRSTSITSSLTKEMHHERRYLLRPLLHYYGRQVHRWSIIFIIRTISLVLMCLFIDFSGFISYFTIDTHDTHQLHRTASRAPTSNYDMNSHCLQSLRNFIRIY